MVGVYSPMVVVMELTPLETLTLSATSLGVLDQCPRLFRYLYIDRLIWPPAQALEDEESLRSGQQFHRLVDLYSRGRSIDTQLRTLSPQIRAWWQTFLASPHAQPSGQIFSELPLWIQVEGITVTAQLDRLRVTEQGVEILDWKTDRVRPSEAQMHRNRQTWLYPLMVCWVADRLPQVLDISPDRIQITFWYVNHPDHPFRQPYSQAQFRSHQQILQQEIHHLKHRHQEDYPMTRHTSICHSCLFRARCYGLAPEGLDPQQLELFEGIRPPATSGDTELNLEPQR